MSASLSSTRSTGQLSRVFGELMYLLEYREEEVPLASGSRFSIPANVRILGTMNTADRSIALVDHALRRRFAFLSLKPDFAILRRIHDGNGFPVERLVTLLQRLNADIRDPHYEVGISFFLRKDLKNDIEDIWRMEIIPYPGGGTGGVLRVCRGGQPSPTPAK